MTMEECYLCGLPKNVDTGSGICYCKPLGLLQQCAVKYDSDKPEYHLIPWRPLTELGKLYQFGANKYEPHNWKKGMAWSRCYNALLRHLQAWWEGETNDPESKCHHLSSVAWCAFTLIWYELYGVGDDDRPKNMP